MDFDDYIKLMKKHKLDPEIIEKISTLIEYTEPFVQLIPSLQSAESSVGSSKIAGVPDLPQNIKWPSVKRQPYKFIAQISVSDIVDAKLVKELKGISLIHFFLEDEEYPPRGKVLAVQGKKGKLVPCVVHDMLPLADIPSPVVLEAVSVSELVTPRHDSVEVKKLNLTEDQRHALEDLEYEMDSVGALTFEGSRLFGPATPLATASSEKLSSKRSAWRVLACFDPLESEDSAEGPLGKLLGRRLYYLIRYADLKSGNFEKVEVCYGES